MIIFYCFLIPIAHLKKKIAQQRAEILPLQIIEENFKKKSLYLSHTCSTYINYFFG